MSFCEFHHICFLIWSELKESYCLVCQELGGDRTYSQFWKLFFTQRQVLLNLHYSYFIIPSLGLNRQYVMYPALVNANIDFVSLHLADAQNSCPKMVLDRITCNTSKNIQKTIVSKLSK